MKKIKFQKMQGLGNDFVILERDEFLKAGKEAKELAIELCDRKFGIGADGLIILAEPKDNCDIAWDFYNSDGTIAQMCGNGMRCFAKYVFDKKIINSRKFSVSTLSGKIVPEILEDGKIKVNMGNPILEPSKIPFKGENNLNYKLEIKDKTFELNAVSMGNPHCVIFTEEDTMKLALDYGKDIEFNSIFPEKTNVEFIKILSRKEINLDVWERGCGITLACGTGACASVVAGILNGLLDNEVRVNLPGGTLNIEWQGDKTNPRQDVYMIGEAKYVFTGEVNI